MKLLDLTGDRPLTRCEARRLANWWNASGWTAVIKPVGRYFGVIAER